MVNKELSDLTAKVREAERLSDLEKLARTEALSVQAAAVVRTAELQNALNTKLTQAIALQKRLHSRQAHW